MKHIDSGTYGAFLQQKYFELEIAKQKMEEQRKIQAEANRKKGINEVSPFINFLRSNKVNMKTIRHLEYRSKIEFELRYDRDNLLELNVDYGDESGYYHLIYINDFVNNINGRKSSTIIKTNDIYFMIEHFYSHLYSRFEYNKQQLIGGVRYLFEANFNGKSRTISFI